MRLLVLRNAHIYAPEDQGLADLWIGGETIVEISRVIEDCGTLGAVLIP